MWEKYQDKGLEIIWILGSTNQKDSLPSPEYMQDYVKTKGITFTVVRDFKFIQTYMAVESFDIGSLPHQYVLDGATMELLDAWGGVLEEKEDYILQKLGVQ